MSPAPGHAAGPPGRGNAATPPRGEVVRLRAGRQLPAAFREFQPDALEIEDRPPARVARLTLYLVAALIASAVGWAAVSEVDKVVVAPGRLVTTRPNLVVQPFETAIVRTIDAAVGDVVKAGSTLATLDPTFPAADLAQLRGRLASRTAQVARLEAEIENRPYAIPDPPSEDDRLQAAVYTERLAYRGARMRDFEERIARTRAAMATNEGDQQAMRPRLDVVRQLEDMRSQLLAGQVGSRVTLLEARGVRLELEGRLRHLQQDALELDHELGKTRAEQQSFVEEYRGNALEELTKLRSERDGIAADLGKAALRRNMVVLTAPADAVVLEVANRSAGSVVREAEPLFTLVPLNAPLEAELALEARDIGHVAPGNKVRVKLDAFPYQEHGTASGTLRVISEGAFARDGDRGGEGRGDGEHGRQAVFRLRARLEDVALRGVPASFRLIPGMTVVGEIQAGRRTVLSYFLHPLLRGLDESLREP